MNNSRNNMPPAVTSTAPSLFGSTVPRISRRQSHAPEFVPAPPATSLSSMAPESRQISDLQSQLTAQAKEIELLKRQFFFNKKSAKRSFGRDPAMSREVQKEYKAFKDLNGVGFDFLVAPSVGDNLVVIDGILPKLLDFDAKRRNISDPQQRLQFSAEIIHRIKKHRESLKAAYLKAQNKTAEQLLQEVNLVMLHGRKIRKIQKRQIAFEAIGNTLPLPRECSSHNMLKKYIFDHEVVSDDEDDMLDVVGGKATKWISVQPSWRSGDVNRIYQLLDDHTERGRTAMPRIRIVRSMPRPSSATVFPEWIYRQDHQ